MKCHFIEQFTKPDERFRFIAPANLPTFAAARIFLQLAKIKAFKLLSIAGAYWLEMKRISNCSAFTGLHFFRRKTSTTSCISRRKRKSVTTACSGSNSIYFPSKELAGPGLIFWHPKGGIISQGDGRLDCAPSTSSVVIRWSTPRMWCGGSCLMFPATRATTRRTCSTSWSLTMRNIA